MPISVLPRAARLLLRVAVIYLIVFAVWIITARHYYIFLGHVAAKLVPLVVDSTVDRVWYDKVLNYKITFHSRDTGFEVAPTQAVKVRQMRMKVYLSFTIIAPRLVRVSVYLVLPCSQTPVWVYTLETESLWKY